MTVGAIAAGLMAGASLPALAASDEDLGADGTEVFVRCGEGGERGPGH